MSPAAPAVRARILDPYLDKGAEWVERSAGKVRADKVHERLLGMGFTGDERTTRRAVAAARSAWWAGHRRTYRPWITEPGLWLQFDWGSGPLVPGPDGRPRSTWLFCAWLAWSRFRVVIPTWDRKLETLLSWLAAALRQLGGVPSYALTDNEKTVTVEHIAGVPVRHPTIVAASRHYGTQVVTCVPFDPESKGGSEASGSARRGRRVPARQLVSHPAVPHVHRRRTRCPRRPRGVRPCAAIVSVTVEVGARNRAKAERNRLLTHLVANLSSAEMQGVTVERVLDHVRELYSMSTVALAPYTDRQQPVASVGPTPHGRPVLTIPASDTNGTPRREPGRPTHTAA